MEVNAHKEGQTGYYDAILEYDRNNRYKGYLIIASSYPIQGATMLAQSYDDLVLMQQKQKNRNIAISDFHVKNEKELTPYGLGHVQGFVDGHINMFTQEQMEDAIKLAGEISFQLGNAVNSLSEKEILESIQPVLQECEVEIETTVETSGIDWDKMKVKHGGLKRKETVKIIKMILRRNTDDKETKNS